jgi:hypothetical protein
MKLRINESLQKLDGGNVLLTDYAGDIANLLVNKPKSYRILYNKHDDVYLIADAMDYIHEEMTEVALNDGWLPKTQAVMKERKMDVDEYDKFYSENIIFIPVEDMETAFGAKFYGMAMGEYGYEFPIETGSVFTKSDFGQRYFQQYFGDLYRRLKNYEVDSNYAFIHDATGWE